MGSISDDKPAVYVMDPYHPDAITALKQATDIRLVLPSDPAKATYHEHATVLLLRSDTRITPDDFAKCKKLKHIVKQGVGVDNIDLAAAKDAGVGVYNTPGLNGETVAELALTMALCLARRVSEIDRRVRAGETVKRNEVLGRSLFRKTLGVVGMGNIGFEVAKKWVGAMSGSLVAYDPYSDGKAWKEAFPGAGQFRQVGSLDEVLEAADVVTLHVPLTEGTRNCIAKPQFERMKDGAILINCARGGVVDEEAMAEALRSGKLGGAGLDAMQVEPPTLQAYKGLLESASVIMTPHIGAATKENQSQSGLAVVNVALGLLRGENIGNRVA